MARNKREYPKYLSASIVLRMFNNDEAKFAEFVEDYKLNRNVGRGQFKLPTSEDYKIADAWFKDKLTMRELTQRFKRSYGAVNGSINRVARHKLFEAN